MIRSCASVHHTRVLHHHPLVAMLASCAEDCAPLEEDKGDWEEGGGDEAEEAEGPGPGDAFDHCGGWRQ